jgi:hypothetical protein
LWSKTVILHRLRGLQEIKPYPLALALRIRGTILEYVIQDACEGRQVPICPVTGKLLRVTVQSHFTCNNRPEDSARPACPFAIAHLQVTQVPDKPAKPKK